MRTVHHKRSQRSIHGFTSDSKVGQHPTPIEEPKYISDEHLSAQSISSSELYRNYCVLATSLQIGYDSTKLVNVSFCYVSLNETFV
ncbi:hypothetical protein MPTK1_5g22860 [Marchantia polymorpha subsp. ruderalis]|uniref:Uncharacterized protein n=2 Tax=Marchantia polymorpha TaxID=3197 RepID=A0AAF6BL97_MARPO|nr:hypothetical protein MARPO_0010s0170 [Marchantia polymorpha]BBN12781.1 hypothetical protein Mp_5g22860 [Marchantia polymorpha subsp. ruderalis]|eukprot:PTQ46798.1 hypothetical protein MARPO_0010s0170 [Marchantia polymorpha]